MRVSDNVAPTTAIWDVLHMSKSPANAIQGAGRLLLIVPLSIINVASALVVNKRRTGQQLILLSTFRRSTTAAAAAIINSRSINRGISRSDTFIDRQTTMLRLLTLMMLRIHDPRF